MRVAVLGLLFLVLAGATACQRRGGVQSKAAVQQAIEEHLKQRPTLAFGKMSVEIGEVTFNGDTAQALVKFRSKEAPTLSVGVLYKLRRSGNGWQVESSSAANMPGTSPHGNNIPPPIPTPATNPALSPQPSH